MGRLFSILCLVTSLYGTSGVGQIIEEENLSLEFTTPFHVSVALGEQFSILKKYLTEENVDINKKDKKGRAPIHYAALYDQETSVTFLCQHNANPNALLEEEDVSQSALEIAMGAASKSAFKALLRNCRIDHNVRELNFERTPLHFAAQHGMQEMIAFLVELKGVELDLLDAENRTALALAVEGGHIKTVRYLISKGADVQTVDEDGATLLHLACQSGHLQIMFTLIQSTTIPIDSLDHLKKSPLMVAVELGHYDIAKFLIEKGGSITRKDTNSTTLLHFAAKSGLIQLMSSLCSVINVNSVNDNSDTPLHFCAQYGKEMFCRHLLQRGADLNTRNNDNFMPKDMAENNKFLSLQFFLTLYKNNTSILTASGDLHFISEAASVSASKIETYVNFVKEQNKFSFMAGETLEKIKKLVNGSRMGQMYDSLDSHLLQAQTHAGQWNAISIQQQTAFRSVRRFGATFLSDFQKLDARVPGILNQVPPSEIEQKVEEFRNELIADKFPSLLIDKKVEERRKQLEGKGTQFDKYLNELRMLLKHVLEYGKECKRNANLTVTCLDKFIINLAQDKSMFEEDSRTLSTITAMMNSSVTLQIKELEVLAKATGEYEAHANASLQEIKYWHNVHMSLGGIGTSFQLMSNIADIGSLVNSFRMSKQASKLTTSLETLKSTRIDYKNVARIQKKTTADFAKFQKLKDAKANLQSSVTKHSFKAKKLAKLGKTLKVAGAVLGVVSVIFSIADLVTSAAKMDRLEKLNNNITIFTEKLMLAKLDMARMTSDLAQIGMTNEQRDVAKSQVLDCIDKVSGAIEESNLLFNFWSDIVANIEDLIHEADKAKLSTTQAFKIRTLDSLRSKLINMKISWDQVSMNALEIKKLQPSVDGATN